MLKDLLKQNRSYRGYDESVRLTREQLLDMVDCARYAPFSQNFQSFKYVLVHTKEDCGKLQPCTGWARGLPNMTLPHPGHCPTGFIVMCYDNTIGPGVERFWKDVGICAQTIGAHHGVAEGVCREMGVGNDDFITMPHLSKNLEQGRRHNGRNSF